MLWIALAVGLIVLKSLVDWWLAGRKRKADARAYRAAANLMSPAEQKFWLALRQAVPPSVMACPKVRLIDVLEPKKGDASARGRVVAKHLDFVLIDVQSTRVLGAIELDDSSHARRDRRERDEFVDAALGYAGVPLLRVPVSRNYDVRVLAGQVRDTLDRKPMKLSA